MLQSVAGAIWPEEAAVDVEIELAQKHWSPGLQYDEIFRSEKKESESTIFNAGVGISGLETCCNTTIGRVHSRCGQ